MRNRLLKYGPLLIIAVFWLGCKGASSNDSSPTDQSSNSNNQNSSNNNGNTSDNSNPDDFDHSNTGWTDFTPSSDTQKIYISSSSGNDSNDGLSELTPLKTFQAGYAKIRAGSADWLLLKKGDVFNQTSTNYWSKSGRALNETLVISNYGTGTDRPIIQYPSNDGNSAILFLQGASHISITGIEFKGPTPTTLEPAALEFFANGGQNILIENCKISGFTNGIYILPVDSNPQPLRNIRIRRNVIVDNYSTQNTGSGVRATNVKDILIEENVMAENGWHEGSTYRGGNDSNILVDGENILILKNISLRASNSGISVFPKGNLSTNRIEGNLVARSLVGIGAEPTGVSISDNIILESLDYIYTPSDGSPPYKASHSFGILLKSHGLASSPNLISNNIITQYLSVAPTVALWIVSNNLGNLTTTTIRNNIVHNFGGHLFSMSTYPGQTANFDQLIVDGNIFQDTQNYYTPAELQYSNSLPNGTRFQFSLNSANSYYSNRPRSSWFGLGPNADPASDLTWKTQIDANAHYDLITFVDANRNLSTYQNSIGKTATFEAFEAELRLQSRDHWQPKYQADSITAYLRAGFAH